jgi:hypothetical protein
MTLDNFNDFLADVKRQEIKNLQNSIINYQNQLFIIDEVLIENSKEEFVLKNIDLNINLKCKFVQLEQIKNLVISTNKL